MNKLLLIILSALIATGLKAQSNLKPKIQSFELLLGIGKVGTIKNDNFVYSLNNSPTYELEYITDKGVEINSRFSSNWTFNKNHEVIIGLDLNIWSRKSWVTNGDIISSWRESSLSNRTISGQIDLIVGYRYSLLLKRGKSLFIENVIHRKLYSGKFPGLKFTVEPGIGIRIKINKVYNFISAISYKQPLGDSEFNQVFQNNFGLRVGINKVL